MWSDSSEAVTDDLVRIAETVKKNMDKSSPSKKKLKKKRHVDSEFSDVTPLTSPSESSSAKKRKWSDKPQDNIDSVIKKRKEIDRVNKPAGKELLTSQVPESESDESLNQETETVIPESDICELEENDDGKDGENPMIRHKISEEFQVQSTKKLLKQSSVLSEDLTDKTLWLIKAPPGVDLKELSDEKITLEGLTDVHADGKDLQVMVVPGETAEIKKFCPVVPSKSRDKLVTEMHFSGCIHIMETLKVPSVPVITVPGRQDIAMPEGLEARYVPFGARSPQKRNRKGEKKKKKKSKKKGHLD